MNRRPAASLAAMLGVSASGVLGADFSAEIQQITFGPEHHFFGYIGHVRTIPWNASGRFIVALRTEFQERMPKPADAADIVLLDARNNYAEKVVEHSRAWNFQQGTMLYWNPLAAETQFFFNDRDLKTGKIFCVLYDLAQNRRVAEYRYDDTPVGNSGVAQKGGWFCALNYARLARLRPVTGYPEAFDWTRGVKHPVDDGIFKINAGTKEKRLILSFKQLADALRATHPLVDQKELFINHTLWNRDDDRIYFYVRGDGFDTDRGDNKFNVPCVMNPDGSGLRPLTHFIGGHPEWELGRRMIGATDKEQILYDTDAMKVAGTLGSPAIFPRPGGDIALAPDANWFVNGHGSKGTNFYTFLRRADGAWFRTAGLDQGGYTSGELRIDPGPLWNRDSTQILVPGVGKDGTRQLFIIRLTPR